VPGTKKKQSFGESLSEAYRQVGPYLGLGTELAASVAGMLLIGYFLDEHFNTSPWLLLTGAAIGTIGGFYNFFREVQKLGKIDTRKRD
jgi:F0F1-type ATP synthase assembly protein I